MSRFPVDLLATFAMLFTIPATSMPHALNRAPRDVVAAAVGLQGVSVRKNFFYVGGLPMPVVITNAKPKMRSGWCLHVPT
jgi:hypothetical protein